MKHFIPTLSIGAILAGLVALPAMAAPTGVVSAAKAITPPTDLQEQQTAASIALDNQASDDLRNGLYAKAEAEATQSIAIGYNLHFGREVLACALAAQGKDQEALSEYSIVVEEGSDFPRDLLPYALLLYKSNQLSTAAMMYNRALPLLGDGALVRANGLLTGDPNQAQALLAAIHVALGLSDLSDTLCGVGTEKDRSVQEFQLAQSIEPDAPLTNYYLGYGLKSLGRASEAKVAFARAASLGTGDVEDAALKELR